ncbi:hypothetical protein ACU6U9_20020 [Pseudomonas sp. HK3]
MIVKGFISCLCLTLLMGCQTNAEQAQISDRIEQSLFDLTGPSFIGTESINIVNKVANLGPVRVQNWPLDQFECNNCQVELSRKNHPDGQDLLLKLVTPSGVTTWVASSYQKWLRFDFWKLELSGSQFTLLNTRSNQLSEFNTDVVSSFSMGTEPNCTILWSNRQAQKQPPKHIADDVADYKSQIIWQCQN